MNELVRAAFGMLVTATHVLCPAFGPPCALIVGGNSPEKVCVKVNRLAERRRWPRLPLAIPVFVRSSLDQDKEFLEFATALNVSAGGMLVAVRRFLPSSTLISLEIPSAPVAALSALPAAARTLSAKVLRSVHSESYSLIGLKFSKPLGSSPAPKTRKATAKRALVSSPSH